MRNFFQSLFVIVSVTLLFSSCSKTTTSGDSIPTSLKLSVDKITVTADGIDKITVTVKDQADNDVSSTSAVYTLQTLPTASTVANYVTGTGISFESTQQGTYKIFATKYSVVSDTLVISTVAPPPAKYSTKILAEEYTGAWAGWCPRMNYKTDNYMLTNNKIFTVRIHNGDALANKEIDSTLRSKFGVTSVPNVVLNRRSFFTEDGDVNSTKDSLELIPYLQKRAVLGLALNTSISGNTLTVTPKVGFDATITDSLKLVVMVVEDGLTLPQTNFYSSTYSTDYATSPFYNSGNPITNYVHNKVVRVAPTTVLGTTIPATSQVKNGEYTTNYTVNIAGYNAAKLQVVAFVLYADSQVKYGLMNAQWVAAGSNKNYD